jgi:hypothetical protein
MARAASKDVEQLAPHLRRLALLEGVPIWLADGLHLASLERVRDAPALVAGGPPASGLVAGCASLRRPLHPVTATWLAAAHRDLRLFESPYRRQVASEARVLRKVAGGEVDARWTEERAGRLEALAAAFRAGPPAAAAGALRPFVVGLARAVHGDAAAAGAEALAARSLGALRPTAGLGAADRAVAAVLRDAMARAVETLVLWFTAREEDLVTAEAVHRLPAALPALAAAAESRLSVGEALRLAAAVGGGDAAPRTARHVAGLVARGLPVASVEEVSRAGRVAELCDLAEPALARAWCGWTARLLPAARRSGLALDLPARRFARAGAGRGAELSALCQLALSPRRPEAAADADPLALLDLVLSAFRHAPAEATALAAALRGGAGGEGARLFPDLARWLGDTTDLDRLAALQRLAGEVPSLSRLVRSDFERGELRAREREHLASLAAPDEGQRRRLARLGVGEGRAPGPARTLRRLREAADAAQARALGAVLERLALAVLRSRWGAAPPRLDAAWVDAVRFGLETDDNRKLLGDLLRAAAARPGEPVRRDDAENSAWLTRASARLSTAGWLAHREREVHLEGRRYVLATEEDPLQVLRMGVPFGTCLSLRGGDGEADGPAGNAAATVVNALDANKRVLYLRDGAGAVVARKLVAVSAEWRLVGYRLYLALPPRTRPAVEAAFLALCEELARGAGVPLADAGTPEQLHAGFWYDDGAVPFGAPSGADARYAARLGCPPGDAYALALEADAWEARERGDVAGVLRRLDHVHHRGPFWSDLADWVAARLGDAALLRLARRDCNARDPVFRRAAAHSALEVVDVLRHTSGGGCAWDEAVEWILLARPVPGAATAWVKLARRFARPRRGRWPAAPLEASRRVLPWLARGEPPAAAAGLAADVADLWRRFGETAPADVLAAAPEADRHAEVTIVQARLGAELEGRDGAAAERAAARDALRRSLADPRFGLGWLARARLASTVRLVEEAALEEGPLAVAAVWLRLPDHACAAAFLERVDARLRAAALRTRPPFDADDDDARLRWEWLRRSCADA